MTALPAPEPGLLLRLAGPLQSWGLHSHFNERDTAPFPTRSGVIGMLASALGRRRGQPIDDLTALNMTVRTDRPGVLLRDLHTVGGGLAGKATVTTAEGKKRPGDTGTLLTHRHYLADAAFTVALTAPRPTTEHRSLLNRCANALRNPQWPLHLGRRSCPPEGPCCSGRATMPCTTSSTCRSPRERPEHRQWKVCLWSFWPTARWPSCPLRPPRSARPMRTAPTPRASLNDQPVSYHPSQRAYRARPLYRRTLLLPHAQFAGLGTQQLTALGRYLDTRLHTTEGSRR